MKSVGISYFQFGKVFEIFIFWTFSFLSGKVFWWRAKNPSPKWLYFENCSPSFWGRKKRNIHPCLNFFKREILWSNHIKKIKQHLFFSYSFNSFIQSTKIVCFSNFFSAILIVRMWRKIHSKHMAFLWIFKKNLVC